MSGDGNIQNQPDEETAPLLENLRVYPHRWYILGAFCLLTCTQSMVWSTWPPITGAACQAYGWDTSTISLLINWGPITYLVFAVPFAWLMDVKGLRWSGLISAGLVLSGATLRCITSSPGPQTWLVHVGQLLNGIPAPFCQAGPSLLSSVWFPPSQRTTATAIGIAFANFGIGISFLLGPAIVENLSNSTDHNISTTPSYLHANGSVEPFEVHVVQERIMELMYIEAGVAGFVFLVFLLYFPAKPKTPPSMTAKVERIKFRSALTQVLSHPKFWTLGLVYAVSTGVGAAWSSVLNINLIPLGVSMWDSGMIGFLSLVLSQLMGMAVGFFSDMFARKMKVLLIILFTFAATMFILFSLVCIRIIPFDIKWLYITAVLGTGGITGGIPLFYELICESMYPISEGVTNSLLTWLNNATSLVFYFILMAPIGTAWMNWFYVGSIAICIPILILYKENYSRLDLDTQNESIESTNDEHA